MGLKGGKMKVLQIIKHALTFVNEPETFNNISSESELLTDADKNTKDLLLACVNLTNGVLASEFYSLKNKVKLNSNGKIPFSQIAQNLKIAQILKVEQNGKQTKFSEIGDYLETVSGEVEITFSHTPREVNAINDTILEYSTKITEQIFAYGVVSEYYYILGMYDDASIWSIRFKNALTSVLRPRHEVKLKGREWI